MPHGDITTDNIMPEKEQVIAEIQAVEKLTFAGSEIVPHCFGDSCRVDMKILDGETAEPGDILGKIHQVQVIEDSPYDPNNDLIRA